MTEGPSEKEKLALHLAADARKLEIGLLWSRSLYFWGILTVLLAFYGAAIDKGHTFYATLTGCFGLLCSLCWTLANRSGKYWQEVWEGQTNYWSSVIFGMDLFTAYPTTSIEERWFWGPKRFSPSKLQMIVSDVSTAVWAILVVAAIVQECVRWALLAEVLMALSTVCFSVVILFYARSGARPTLAEIRQAITKAAARLRTRPSDPADF